MASVASDLLKLELITAHTEEDTWGDKANNTFQRFEQAVHGVVSLTTALTSPYTLNDTQYTGTESHRKAIRVSGAQTANIEIRVPGRTHHYIVLNDTTGSGGSFTVTVKVTGQTGVALVHGERAILWCNGTDVEPLFRSSAYMSKASNLSDVASVTTARTNLGLLSGATTAVGTSTGQMPTVDQADLRYRRQGVREIWIPVSDMIPWPVAPCGALTTYGGAVTSAPVFLFNQSIQSAASGVLKMPNSWNPAANIVFGLVWLQNNAVVGVGSVAWFMTGRFANALSSPPPGTPVWHTALNFSPHAAGGAGLDRILSGTVVTTMASPGDLFFFLAGRNGQFAQDTMGYPALLKGVFIRYSVNRADDS